METTTTATAGDAAWIGRSLRRREDPDLLTGRGRFAADPSPPGLVHLAIRRAGLPHAGGCEVDLAPALAMPGVAGAWTRGGLGLADDFMPDSGPEPEPVRRPVLAGPAARFEGDALAVVAAETAYQAQDAADAIGVDLTPLELDPAAAGGSIVEIGDAGAAFEGAPVIVREHLSMGRICGGAMEPRAVLAEWLEAERRLVVRASVGWAQGLRDTLAACMGLATSQVEVVIDDVGGSFGAKNQPYPEYVMAAAISRLLNRPVRWVASRSEDGHTTGQAHGAELDLELAAEPDGRLRGIRGKVRWAVGAYMGRGANQDRNMGTHMVSAYRLPALQVQVEQRFSHSPPAAHIRGGGRPIGNFAVERMLDRLARRLGLDPVDVRRRNLLTPADMPHRTGVPGMVYDGGDYPRLLDLAVERIGSDEVRQRQRHGEPVGLGVAMCVESTGVGMREDSRIRVAPDGIVTVSVGSTPQGQGHRTFVAQVVADRLGWPLERVQVRTAQTDGIASAVTAGSRSALEVGNSVALSARAARRMLAERAAELLEVAPEDLQITVEGAMVRGVPGRGLALSDLVGGGLEAAGTWDSNRQPAWASSCHAAVVMLDVETGAVEVLRYLISHDSGRIINPLLLEGQLHGGYAHGLGYALFEEAAYRPDGSFLAPSFLDYPVVSPPEMNGRLDLVHTETESSQNPEGFRGVGEAGTIAVPAAIANAVEDALYALGREVCVNAIPITPERLWRRLGQNPSVE
jgi:carbon-monoxide dehydrogenase large subunit